MHEPRFEPGEAAGLRVTPAGRGLALAGAAALVFGGAFAVGNAAGGEDAKETSPAGAQEVAVPAAEASAPTLASVGKLPQLRPAPATTGNTTSTSTTTTGVGTGTSGSTTSTTTPPTTSTTTTTTGTTGSGTTTGSTGGTTTGSTGGTTGGSTTGSSTTTTTGG